MRRSLLVVIGPWILWGGLDTGIYALLRAMAPDSFPEELAATSTAGLVALLVLRAVYSFVAGVFARWIAADRQQAIYAAIGVLVLTGIVVQLSVWNDYPLWFHLVFLLSVLPAAWAGSMVLIGAARASKPAAA